MQEQERSKAILDLLESYGATLAELSDIKYKALMNGVEVEKIILPRVKVLGIDVELGDVPHPHFIFKKEGSHG